MRYIFLVLILALYSVTSLRLKGIYREDHVQQSQQVQQGAGMDSWDAEEATDEMEEAAEEGSADQSQQYQGRFEQAQNVLALEEESGEQMQHQEAWQHQTQNDS